MRYLFILIALTIFSCNSPAEPEKEKIPSATVKTKPASDLENYLDTLNSFRVESISQGVLFYQQNYGEQQSVCDSQLVILKNFALHCAENLNSVNAIADFIAEDGTISDEEENKFKKLGLLVGWAEGSPYFIVDAGYLRKHLGKCISAPMNRFMEEFEVENENVPVEDGGLVIEMNELQRRLLFWERFIEENTGFILEDEARVTYNFYLAIYMTGIDNTPAFDNQSMKLDEKYKTSFTSMIKSDPQSKTVTMIREYYSILAENDFMLNKEVEDYLMTVGSPYPVQN
jgi:hypothetical protein